MTRHVVMLVFGGESSEHDISIKSAHNVYAALDNERYEVVLCYIDRAGKWWLTQRIDGGHIGQPQLVPVLGQKQFITLPGNRIIRPDVLIPMLHGVNGEDGSIQGVAKMLHLPVVGPSLASAAITIDKDLTKRLVQEAGISVAPWILWRVDEPHLRYSDVVSTLGTALFIKPATAGSSLGVSKVTTEPEWLPAIKLASQHCQSVLIETAIEGREIEVAVYGNSRLQVSRPGEKLPGEEYYTYADKYAPSSTSQITIPAELSLDTESRIRGLAGRSYRAVNGHGMARLDFFIDAQGKILLNEINSIPGFTNISMFPKLWHAEGMKYPELVDKLISLAME